MVEFVVEGDERTSVVSFGGCNHLGRHNFWNWFGVTNSVSITIILAITMTW
jgi:hypothetical protein